MNMNKISEYFWMDNYLIMPPHMLRRNSFKIIFNQEKGYLKYIFRTVYNICISNSTHAHKKDSKDVTWDLCTFHLQWCHFQSRIWKKVLGYRCTGMISSSPCGIISHVAAVWGALWKWGGAALMESGVDWPDGVLLSPAVVTVTSCDFYRPANNGSFHETIFHTMHRNVMFMYVGLPHDKKLSSWLGKIEFELLNMTLACRLVSREWLI